MKATLSINKADPKDDVFGYERFINEIVWCYTGAGIKSQKNYSRKHDNILFYTKTNKTCFHRLA
jgi:adenine specific DNA methylase Mod